MRGKFARPAIVCLGLGLLMAGMAAVWFAVGQLTHTPPKSALSKKTPQTCEQKVALVNYRSDVLAVYQQSEQRQYQNFRKKWATRISYASQWVPAEATKARDALYQYDALRDASDRELDQQIKDYAYLEAKPLDCSVAYQAELTRKLAEVKGLKGKKVIGGNALLNQDKKRETTYLNEDFKKSSEAMVKDLHQAKSKHPKPPHLPISIDT